MFENEEIEESEVMMVWNGSWSSLCWFSVDELHLLYDLLCQVTFPRPGNFWNLDKVFCPCQRSDKFA
ncbi:hypothetical protein PsorP6_015444 [Peronosclerospora sorghi]|uniref:Uncharacterized protein n=1 Tax=Peronosclerospora sorghi TaxID=230839 RepID=A0ACC0WMX4_9STRA|nr:hypothetical protein PsorP6_015444 [Peronosclerospora sorghi]